MIGPLGEKHWSRSDYTAITPLKNYATRNSFCDENGNVADTFPSSTWNNTFSETTHFTTLVSIEITHQSLDGLEKIIAMGFQGGFTMGLGNLDELLSK
jgi:hypothetical protein